MKKILTIALALFVAAGSVSAAKKKSAAKQSNKPVFTIVKEIPVTSMKDQNRSGTCWDYSTLSFFEAEILKATGKKYDLCESFIANKTYMDRAIQVVRYHGDCQFAQGGSAEDVLATLKTHGICPEDAMPFPGSLYGDSLNNFNEFFGVLEPYVAAVAKSSAKKISNAWKNGFQGILDAYLGKCPEKFTFEGKEYTPKSFMNTLGLNLDDYVSITSYTHHPFYTTFAVEVQDNWRFPQSYNLPMEEMMEIIDNAIEQGYTVAWGGDVSEDGFTRKGLAYAVDTKATESLAGSDMARWLKLAPAKKTSILD
jgi:aminopeptidase C